MTTAGCAGLSGDDAGTTTGSAVEETTETPEADTTTSSETTAESTESDDHSETDDNESTTNASTSIDAEYSGEMAAMVGDERVDLAAEIGSEDAISMANTDTWYTNESVTLSTALEGAGVDAEESTLTYDGETYDESTDGTEIYYRVGSHEVNPEEYTLESDDKIWVLVVTEDSDVSTPGEYIPPENLHVHGTIDFTVDGEELDFTRDKYQQAGHNDHFHFEGGHANPWHAHSAHVTLAYAMSTLEGINMTEESITYNGTTYSLDDEEGGATVKVNGEAVDPSEYYLKNGDSVTIEIESSD